MFRAHLFPSNRLCNTTSRMTRTVHAKMIDWLVLSQPRNWRTQGTPPRHSSRFEAIPEMTDLHESWVWIRTVHFYSDCPCDCRRRLYRDRTVLCRPGNRKRKSLRRRHMYLRHSNAWENLIAFSQQSGEPKYLLADFTQSQSHLIANAEETVDGPENHRNRRSRR